jgi:hypothetical protein
MALRGSSEEVQTITIDLSMVYTGLLIALGVVTLDNEHVNNQK